MIYFFIVLAIMLVLFLFCVCKVSSKYTRLEEEEVLKNEFGKRI